VVTTAPLILGNVAITAENLHDWWVALTFEVTPDIGFPHRLSMFATTAVDVIQREELLLNNAATCTGIAVGFEDFKLQLSLMLPSSSLVSLVVCGFVLLLAVIAKHADRVWLSRRTFAALAAEASFPPLPIAG